MNALTTQRFILRNETSMSAKSSSPEDENVCNSSAVARQRTHKVILPIKPNFSSSSRNKDTSISCDYLFSEEPNFDFRTAGGRSKSTAVRPRAISAVCYRKTD